MKANAVTAAVQAAGGAYRVCILCDVSYWAVRDWKLKNEVTRSRHAVLLARAANAAGHRVTVDELAGLEPLNGHGPHK